MSSYQIWPSPFLKLDASSTSHAIQNLNCLFHPFFKLDAICSWHSIQNLNCLLHPFFKLGAICSWHSIQNLNCLLQFSLVQPLTICLISFNLTLQPDNYHLHLTSAPTIVTGSYVNMKTIILVKGLFLHLPLCLEQFAVTPSLWFFFLSPRGKKHSPH